MSNEEQIANIILEIRQSHLGNESFKVTAEKIVESDTFRNADDFTLVQILIDLMHEVYIKTKGKCTKVYSVNRRQQTESIKAQLYATEPPRLDFNIH